MSRLVAAMVVVFGLAVMGVAPLRAEVTAEQVRDAIDRGVNYLLAQQRDDGSWSDYGDFSGGISALGTLALLNAGIEADQEKMQKALNHLRTIGPEKTYVVSLQTMVLARARLDRDRELVLRNVKWLESTQITKGPSSGAWPYSGGVFGDNSNAQFALLALYEAERVGVSASDQTWRLAKAYWEKCQNADGSWGYRLQYRRGTGSMTCAGITSLVIAADTLQASDSRSKDDYIECCLPRNSRDTDRIERAINWLGENYSVASNPNGSYLLYYLYGLERAGRLTARRFIPLPPRPGQPNRADWYREGADFLVRTQDQLTGCWTERGLNDSGRLVGTSFALLFLSKGRWPVLLGKLQYGNNDDWNHHRHDVSNLTHYVESRWKRDLTWQVIDLRRASVDDLIQTPVLYLCGSRSPVPEEPTERKELARKLRDYLDRGGFLVAEADCGCGDFDAGFRDLMREMFPEPEYRLRLLEREHPIWQAEEKVDPRQLRPLWGIESDCRTSVVYAPPDPINAPRPSLSCLWELSRPGRGVKYSAAVQVQIDAALSLGINVLAYATNRELKTKESFFRPTTAPSATDQLERGLLYVANLRHPGGCNATPRAVERLMDSAARQLKIRAHVREEPLDITDPSLFDYHLAFMHGRNAFRLTDRERQQLKQYIERGGMLMVDSICTSQVFSESFRQEMTAVFPNGKLRPIPVSDPMLGTTYGGFDLQTVSRRDPKTDNRTGAPEATVHKVQPALEGIKLGDRWGVVFSPYDLSCGLEKSNSPSCRGYTQEDAARIGLNVVLYSLQQ